MNNLIILWVIAAIVGPFLGFLPTIIGRKKRNCRAILALNFFLGWTIIGWIAAFIWALMEDTPEDAQRARPLNITQVMVLLILLNFISFAIIWRMQVLADRQIERFANVEPAPTATPRNTPAQPDILPKTEQQACSESDLVIIRGTVLQANGNVLIVSCDVDPEPPALNFSGPGSATMGAGQSASLAKWAIHTRDQKILEQFGPLKIVSSGVLQNANGFKNERILGRFALSNFPNQSAEAVHVVATPTGETFEGLPVYSANFSLAVRQQAAVSQLAYPPGVDTPEERRAYLQAMAEARKKRAGQTGN